MKRMKLAAILAAAVVAVVCAAGVTAKESADITVFRPAINPRNPKDPMVRAKVRYEKETGGKVTLILGDWGNWQSKVLTYMAAGNPIDVIFTRDADFPKFYIKGYVQPLEKYVNLDPVVDGVHIMNKQGMDNCFKYNGHYYAASHVTSNHYWIIIYNKTLMEEEGIPESRQPLALYQSGQWTWSNLRKLAVKLTKDTSGSGTIDRWGFGNWWTQGFAYMNGTSFVKSDGKGNMSLNFEDQRIQEALSFLEQAKKEGWYQQDNNIAKDGIQKRTIAMFMEREYTASTILKDSRDELAYVPLPVGPGNKNPQNIFECDGYGIGNGSKNPTYAGKYINYCLEEWYKDDMASRKKTWPQEVIDMTASMQKKAWYPGTTDSALVDIMNDFLGEIIWTGNSPSTAVAAYTPKAAALISDANKPMEKIERLPFKTLSLKFTTAKEIAAFPVFEPEKQKGVKISQAAGKDTIDGKGGLKISMDYTKDGQDVTATVSDTKSVALVGWREYKIDFDVKALKKPGDGAYVFIQVYGDPTSQWGWNTQNVTDANEVIHVTKYVTGILQNGKMGLKIGGHNMNDFVIGNLVISEKDSGK